MNPRQALALAGRLLVGGVLIYAGATKAAGPVEEFAYVISAYELVPKDFLQPLAAFLPWMELLAGWALLLGVQTRYAASGGLALFGAFLFSLSSVMARGIPLSNCGCFGGSFHFSPPQTFALDLAAAALLVAVLRWGPGPLSLDSWSERGLSSPR